MYRTCDIEQKTKLIRMNIPEDLAKIGNRLVIPSLDGIWTVKRTHGYSIFSD